ncbi:MAG: type II toxin-antitoxin system VapB family antitoxin [Methylococcales bacterium]|nr:type II toxin-antitoxin system VapB family antitoxin [Methylococcales bacterium]
MATSLALDNNLFKLALKVGGFKPKKDTVNSALIKRCLPPFYSKY